ncbi:hypothetical protein O3M35_008585 [Rhynocoris fuscipes]|uniref:Uncharacterized protein n=1 Tax=Rhynocoris fuscipes TaxID=488301 RepID=A0AAW1D6T8_9HEMI
MDANCKFLEEQNWKSNEVRQHMVEVSRDMSAPFLTLVQTLEEDREVGIAAENIPSLRDKYVTISTRIQEHSTLHEHPKTKVLTKASINSCLTWSPDHLNNIKDDEENLEKLEIIPSSEAENNDSFINDEKLIYLESKETKEEGKGFRGWLKKKFRNGLDESNSCYEKYDDKKFFSLSQKFSKDAKTKFCVFDCNGMPLTDLQGNILKNFFGQPLLLFDSKGRPLDKDGAPVYDSRGIASDSRGFCPNESNRVTKSSPIAMYDSKGYPLTGIDGHILLDPSGEPLVKFSSSNGLVISDITGGGVWDDKGTPLCTIERKWLDQERKPYRLFLKNGLPATDTLGRELFTINNEPILMKDSYGRPINVQDIYGVSISAYTFDGTLHPPNEVESFCYFRGKPIRLYNSRGHPYTDIDGRVLFDSFGTPLVHVDFNHNPLKTEDGSCLFDERKVPLFCNPAKPMKTMEGKPFLLFDKSKRPLTDPNGVPLVSASGALLLKFDEIGRPYADQQGKPICDKNGNEIFDAKFDATINSLISTSQLQITYPGKAGLVVYDKSGRPLTDNEGNALVNSDGTSMEFNIIKQKKKVLKQEYDSFGRPLYDKFNRSLYCHGKPIFNLFGEKIIDVNSSLSNNDYTRSGNFNIYGIPVNDKYDRLLYDEHGMPLCDKTGLPESKAVYNCYGILLSVSDNVKQIRMPRDYARMLYGLSYELNGVLVGFPVENSAIPDDWILPSDFSKMSLEDNDSEYYSVLLRTSTLSELNMVHEILALYPVKCQ